MKTVAQSRCRRSPGRRPLGRGHGPVCDQSRQAFTLVELLVVIVILSFLISLLVPTLSSARRSARTAACLCDIRKLGMTFTFYAMDNNGYLRRRTWKDMPGVTTGYTWPAELWSLGYVKNLTIYSCPEMEILGGRADFERQNDWVSRRQPTD